MYKIFPLLVATILAAIGGTGAQPNRLGGFSFDFGGISGKISAHSNPNIGSFVASASRVEISFPEDEYNDYFQCPIYGPFNVGDPDFDATFKYRADIENQDIIERLRIINSLNRVVSAQSHPSIHYFDNELIETTFTIPIHDYLTNEGITIKFEIVNKKTYSVLKEYSTTLYPITVPSLSSNYLKSNSYQSNPIAFCGDGTQMKEIYETIDFTYIGDYLDADYYYRLNIKYLYFYYRSDLSLSYNNIAMRFNDNENLFPYFAHDANNNVVIPLKTSISRSKVTLDYLHSFYTNKRTLQSSDNYRPGFVSTKDLYLPINGRKTFNYKQIYIDFYEFGKSQITVSFPVRYIADKALIGVCSDGGYCVSGGSK